MENLTLIDMYLTLQENYIKSCIGYCVRYRMLLWQHSPTRSRYPLRHSYPSASSVRFLTLRHGLMPHRANGVSMATEMPCSMRASLKSLKTRATCWNSSTSVTTLSNTARLSGTPLSGVTMPSTPSVSCSGTSTTPSERNVKNPGRVRLPGYNVKKIFDTNFLTINTS